MLTSRRTIFIVQGNLEKIARDPSLMMSSESSSRNRSKVSCRKIILVALGSLKVTRLSSVETHHLSRRTKALSLSVSLFDQPGANNNSRRARCLPFAFSLLYCFSCSLPCLKWPCLKRCQLASHAESRTIPLLFLVASLNLFGQAF